MQFNSKRCKHTFTFGRLPQIITKEENLKNRIEEVVSENGGAVMINARQQSNVIAFLSTLC